MGVVESVDDCRFWTEVSCDLVGPQGGRPSLPGLRRHGLLRRLLDLGRGGGGGGPILL